MARRCDICGKGPSTGKTISKRGRPKREGGVGIKQTGITNRKFKPNIQRVWASVEGKKKKVRACTQCIKSGEIIKPKS